MSEHESSHNALLLFLLGAAVGVAAGILIAPRSGKETRKRLARWKEDMEDKGEDLLEEGKELFEKGKDAVHEKVENIQKAVESAVHKVQEKNR